MAELPKDIRRPGGDLVASKSPHGRRLLLPTEIELCKLLNLTEDEYWYFVDKTAAYNGQRPAGYELIPDIRADIVTAYIAKNIISIGIAIAAATVSYLLTPKPKELKQGGSRRTADAIGNTKFAPQASFNSVQELAQLGDAIPLIFTNQTTEGDLVYGGVRVNSQLLWSQFVSLGKYQQLKALALFSYGTIGEEPDYEGFAVGDTLLNTYNAHKVGLYFKDGSNSGDNRIVENNIDKYDKSKLTFTAISNSDDPFEVGVPNKAGTHVPRLTSKSFSGARNPTTQTLFGAYGVMPNCQICRLPYSLVRDPLGADPAAINDLMRKRKKVEFAKWPTRAGILKVNSIQTKGLYSVNEDDIITYQIVGMDSGEANALQRVYDNDPNTEGYQESDTKDPWNYRPHGVEDVDNLTTSIRESADSLLTVGEQYLMGTAVVLCTAHPNHPAPWTIDNTKHYLFKVIEPGEIDIPVDGANLGRHCSNPVWVNPRALPGLHNWKNKKGKYSLSDFGEVFWQQEISETEENFPRGTNDLYYGHDIYTLQRVALATVTNNRKCDVTEIGIKSRVYKRIQFANVNSQPDEASLGKLAESGTQIQLGQVNTYANRISLFMLQIRPLGSSDWTDLKNDLATHTGLFAVKGNTPESQYNAITISHPVLEQYEYRFKPYPGNYITRNKLYNRRFNLLYTDGAATTQASHFSVNTSFGTFDIAFSGNEGYEISETEACNPEWKLGTTSTTSIGIVTSARHNGHTYWVENPSFNGAITSCQYEEYTTHTDGSYAIVLWNEVTNPAWAAAHGHQWSLYLPGGVELTNSNFANNNGAWDQVWFEDSQKKYYVASPSDHYHPENNNHKFYVEEHRYICKEETINKYVHFDGSVDVLDGTGQDLKVKLKVEKQEYETGQYYYSAEWSLDSDNLGSGYTNGDVVRIPWTDVGGTQRYLQVQLLVAVQQITTSTSQNFNPFDALADWNVYEGDENSNRSDPDHEIVYVNEILKPVTDKNDVEYPAKYNDLAFAGIRINSSKEWTNFSQFSAYFKKGIKVYDLLNSSINNNDVIAWAAHQSSNLFPEIAYSLLASTEIGAGKLVGVDSIDFRAMKNSADFCQKNNFFWDGVISSKLNLRDFIFEHAGYCLLDFTIIGGRFSLKPSVPVNSNNEIDKTVLPEIKCLFTDGNINDLQVSFLMPEERQTFKAVVLYREEKINGFPETKSLIIREKDPEGSETDPIETFDLSGFCTSKTQAMYFAFFAIRSRRLIDHGLTFKTAPQYVQGLAPGDYFRLVSEATHTSRFSNGAKLKDGTIVSKDDVAGSESVFYWETGTEGVKSGPLSTVPNGSLFTVKNTTTENKVYKCETIAYGNDGLLEISGSFAPTESNGQLSVMQHWGLNQDILSFEVTEDYD